MTHWLAQNGEDRIISEWLAEHHPTLVGRVLDIGAHDGWSLSNTARLLERGWGGVLVEPSPRPLAALLDRWGDREDITIVGACVSPCVYEDSDRLVSWHDDRGAACHDGKAFLSTTEAANVAKWQGATKFRRMMLPVIGPHDLVRAWTPRDGQGPRGRFWDVISIDTEGTSVDVTIELLTDLASCGMSYGRQNLLPLVVVVEHDDRIPEIAQHCEKHGLRIIHTNAENVIAVRS